jgi:hypothetical protein
MERRFGLVLRRLAATVWALAATQAAITVGPGGLVSYPVPQIGSNLLTNAGFEELNPKTGKPSGWTDNGFSADNQVARSGTDSYLVKDPYLNPYAESAWQDLPLKKGVYRIGGWVKTSHLGNTRPTGVRICLSAPAGGPATLGSGCTAIVKGTGDWQHLDQTRIVIAQDTVARFSMGAYGKPDGSAWFDDVEVRREQQTLSVFMLYPNYRGILFDDQSQTARFELAVDPPVGRAVADFQLSGDVTDESSGLKTALAARPAAESTVLSVDLASLAVGRSCLVTFRVAPVDGSGPEYAYPAYRIVKQPGRLRASMTFGFDERNRFLIRGKPSFILGVYDSGLGYTSTESLWANAFTSGRRLFELPINVYLNYWLGAADNSSILPMMSALKRHGILTLTNANCFTASPVEVAGADWYLKSPEPVIKERTSDPGFGGFYAADECQARLAPGVLTDYRRMQRLDPGGIVLGTLLPSYDLVFWRDSVDVLGTDPYPIVGSEPAGGYPLSKVSDAARLTHDTLIGSRPFVMTLQFFKGTANSRWPTAEELRSMSFAAIAEGANGLLYWSLGARGLAWVCSDWCATRVDYFERLKGVMTEIKSLEPVLTSPECPEMLLANSNPKVRTRVFCDGRKAYLIGFNASNSSQEAVFQWKGAIRGVWLAREKRSVRPDPDGFCDTFLPNQAHVYEIQ